MEPLLTPEQVADLLQISVKTVKKASVRQRLGGFYPVGLRALRFRPEVIRGVLAGQGQGVEIQVREGGQDLFRPMVCHQGGCPGGEGGAPQAPKTNAEKQRLAADLGFRLTDP